MRTATHFYRGKDFDEFCKIFSEFCPVGKVTIIADDSDKAEMLAKKLKKDYSVEIFNTNSAPENVSGVRFYIGVGGKGVIPAVKRTVNGGKYAFIAADCDYRYLFDFDGNFSLPEFVFLEDRVIEKENTFPSIYVTVFELYSEIIFRLVYGSMFPYRDRVLEGLKQSLETFLNGETAADEYVKEGLRLITVTVNELFARKTKSLITAKMCNLGGMSLSDKFGIAYFLQLLVMNFTKRSFRDILIPSEKTFNCKTVPSCAFDSNIINGELLTKFVGKVRSMIEITPPSIMIAVKLLTAVTDETNPLFSTINNKGIPDALYYEKFKRNRSIFV